MKKLLLTITTMLALSSFSAFANYDLHPASYNWNRTNSITNTVEVNYETMLRLAKFERRAVAKMGFEWKGIGGFLKKAKKLHKTGNDKGAIALLDKARKQAILGQKQAQDQANAGPNF
jgi:hypothetical protein